MRLYSLAILFVFVAGTASAGTTWSNRSISPKRGSTISIYTPDVSADQTQTLPTRDCGSITITVFGTTLTGMPETCDADYAAGNAVATIRCQEITVTALSAAATHSVQVEPAPSFIRLASVTNEDSIQFFHVSCNGSAN